MKSPLSGLRITAGMLGTGDFVLRLQRPGSRYALSLHRCKASPWGSGMVQPHEMELKAGARDWIGGIRTVDSSGRPGMIRKHHDLMIFGELGGAVRDSEAMARFVLGSVFPAREV